MQLKSFIIFEDKAKSLSDTFSYWLKLCLVFEFALGDHDLDLYLRLLLVLRHFTRASEFVLRNMAP